MILKNNKGITMAVVIMIMLVLFLVGSAFLSVSAYQNTQASNQDKGMRAHYLARAGAEAALKAWLDAPADAKPSGTLDTVYLSQSDQFTELPDDPKGNFVVTINQENTSTTAITSVGTVGDIEKKVTVTINKIQEVIPAPNPDYVSGEGFYNSGNGHIGWKEEKNFEWPEIGKPTKGIVKNERTKGANKLQAGGNGKIESATQRFEKILFTASIKPIHFDIILESNVIVFMDEVALNSGTGSSGKLILKVYDDSLGDEAITLPPGSDNWGAVIFAEDNILKGYFFKKRTDGVVLENLEGSIDYHLNTTHYLVPINNNDLNNLFNLVTGGVLTIPGYNILWSK